MTGPFGREYADAYDALYADKDYEAECRLLESIASRYGHRAGSILDLGSGTGRHALILASRGWRVVGVDLSDEMLAVARQRATEAGIDGVEYHRGDVRTFRTLARFDVVLLMFAVLGYQLSDSDVEATLDTAAHHLSPRGVVIFDVWNGPAVEAIGPGIRAKSVRIGSGLLRRTAHGTLDAARRTCTVDYTLERIDEGEVIRTDHEQHQMRYFFPDELSELVGRVGLRIVESGAFPDYEEAATAKHWNVLYVARRTGDVQPSGGQVS